MLPQLDAGVGLDLNGPVWEMFNFLFLTFSSNMLQDFHMNNFKTSIFSKGLMSSFLYCRSACDSTLEISEGNPKKSLFAFHWPVQLLY